MDKSERLSNLLFMNPLKVVDVGLYIRKIFLYRLRKNPRNVTFAGFSFGCLYWIYYIFQLSPNWKPIPVLPTFLIVICR